ncbi:MAG: hypothetical protein R3D98_12035 [Candidatus Krumholzibacteriia bacterium]
MELAFSALAQSSAAIVGLMGAFVFSKVISNQTSLQQRRHTYDDLRVSIGQPVSAVELLRFSWVNQLEIERFRYDAEIAVMKDEVISTRESYRDRLSEPMFVSIGETFEIIDEVIREETSRREAGKPADSPSPPWLQVCKPMPFGENVKGSSRHLVTSLLSVIESVAFDESGARPESSTAIRIAIGACIVLFAVGVIYPLGLMPTDNFDPGLLTVKAVLPAVLSFKGSAARCRRSCSNRDYGYFAFLDRNAYIDDRLLAEIAEYSEPGKYSKHFSWYLLNSAMDLYEIRESGGDGNLPTSAQADRELQS